MKSIIEAFENFDEKEDWNYYNCKNLNNPFLGGENHNEFIEKYFSKSGKLNEMPNEFNTILEDKDSNRIIHSNSLYFLGCLFYKELKLEDRISNERLKGKNFIFIWFMTALGHDFGYKYENDFEAYKDSFNSLQSIKNKFSIKKETDLFSLQREHENKIGKLYNQIEKYFNYRYKKGKIDHGILSALVLFHSLAKHRKSMEKSENDDFNWKDEVTIDYAHACIAIGTHNIWNLEENIQKEYNIILTDIFPLKFDEYPLLFLLGLIDTIEPLKIFDCVKSNNILENILIDFKDNKTIILKNKDNSILDFQKLVKRTNEMEKWLSVKLCKQNNQLKITIL